MIYKLELGHNAAEANKNIFLCKIEGTVDHSAVIRWFKKLYSDCKNLNDQAWSSRPKMWILRLCSKPSRQTWLVVLSEY